ncbi:hypothetical protein [Desulfosporosinus fructosivorans]
MNEGQKTGVDMEVANEIGQPNQSTQHNNFLNDSIGLSPDKLRDSEERELTFS